MINSRNIEYKNIEIKTLGVHRDEIDELKEFLDINDWKYKEEKKYDKSEGRESSFIIINAIPTSNYAFSKAELNGLIDYLDEDSWSINLV